ncbi:hypothetical protein MNBD_GAMMA15-1950 [hydrothermal vent metagenome]|uniref:Putative zinc-finger domain-containing protein n=1 Tax=hydrothermal vent metagenome TaxID=652676 RepID=A0A3B0Z1J8_9ZZZZ
MKLSCKDVSFVASESLDRRLSLQERLSLKIHLLMCKACQRMVQQMKLLRAASHYFGTTEEDSSHPGQTEALSGEARTRILERLQSAEQDHTDHK